MKELSSLKGVTLIRGAPGTGKTMLASKLVAQSKGNAIYLSSRTSELMMRGIPGLEKIRDRSVSASKKFISGLDARVSLDELANNIIESAHIEGGTIVLDSLTSFAEMHSSHEAALLRGLGNAFLKKDVRMIAISENTIDDIGYLADDVFTLSEEIHERARVRIISHDKSPLVIERKMNVYTFHENAFYDSLEFPQLLPFSSERWKTIAAPPGRVSTGSRDLDALLNGGYLHGTATVILFDDEAPTMALDLLGAPFVLNALSAGLNVAMIPPILTDANHIVGILSTFTDPEHICKKFRILEVEVEGAPPPNSCVVRVPSVPDLDHDLSTWRTMQDRMRTQANGIMRLLNISILETRYIAEFDKLISSLLYTMDTTVMHNDVFVGFANVRDKITNYIIPPNVNVIRLSNVEGTIVLRLGRTHKHAFALLPDDSTPFPGAKLIPLV